MYYCYALLDPRKPGDYEYFLSDGSNIKLTHEPFYIGKGKGDRMYQHCIEARSGKAKRSFKNNKILKIISGNYEVIEHKFQKEFADEESAYAHEELLIFAIGRACLKTGPLTNRSSGGNGMRSSDEGVRKKTSRSILKYRSNLTPQELDNISNRVVQAAKNMTAEQKAIAEEKRRAKHASNSAMEKSESNDKRAMSWRATYAAKDAHTREKDEKNRKVAQRAFYDSLTKEEKNELIKISREALRVANSARTEDEWAEINKKISYSVKEARANWSDEQRAAFREKCSASSSKRDFKSSSAKRAASLASKPKIICPHCGKEGTYPKQMDTYHFDNCTKRQL
jgi:hypothetical protein